MHKGSLTSLWRFNYQCKLSCIDTISFFLTQHSKSSFWFRSRLRNIRWTMYALPLVALSSWVLIKKGRIPEQLETIVNDKIISVFHKSARAFLLRASH